MLCKSCIVMQPGIKFYFIFSNADFFYSRSIAISPYCSFVTMNCNLLICSPLDSYLLKTVNDPSQSLKYGANKKGKYFCITHY